MSISVVCPGCKKRFNVSDKYAGQKGPCPQCKAVIQVPAKGEEVVVHAPETFGPKDTKGRAVLKPIARKETKVSPLWATVIGISILAVLIVAIVFRGDDVPTWLKVLGALGLAPPLAIGGYAFLRDDELEPFRGIELMIRAGSCAVVYAALWGLVAIIGNYLFDGDPLEVIHMVFIIPVMVGIGAFAAFASLDFDFSMAAVHYGMYLLVTVTLRLIMGLSAIFGT